MSEMESITRDLVIASTYRVLTKKEEGDLIRSAQAGDQKALTLLIKHNLRLVISIARRFQGRGVPLEDLVQEGKLGLMRAIRGFELDRNLKLSTYATQWIRQFVNRSIENKGKLIRIPIHMLSKITEIKRIFRKYTEDNLGVTPSSEEIAALYNMNLGNKRNFKPITYEEAEELGRFMQDLYSLDDSTSEDDHLTIMHYIGSENSDATEATLDKEYLKSLLTILPEEDRIFLEIKYGFLDWENKSDHQMAELFQTTVKEIKKKEEEILMVLREAAERNKVNMEKGITTEKFNLVLESTSNKPLQVSEILYKDYRFSNSQIAAALKFLPMVVASNLSYDEAAEGYKKFKLLGAKASIIPSK